MLEKKELYKGKNLFFISNIDKFFKLQADSLINKVGVSKESIIAIVFESDRKADINKIDGIQYIDFDLSDLNLMVEASSLTFISLGRWNAPIAEQLINKDKRVLSKLYIFITDDEVERWRKNYEKNNYLAEDLTLNTSKSVLSVLQSIKKIIAPEPYFKELILKVINRRDIEFINCSLIFEILPTKSSKLLKESIETDKVYLKLNNTRALIGTKAKGFKIIPFLRIFNDFSRNQKYFGNKVELLVYQNLYSRFLINAYLFTRKILKIKNSKITFLSEMPPHLYASLIASCDYIFLQDRGGASTARNFVKWGGGVLFIKDRSPNYYLFKDVYKADFITYDKRLKISDRLRQKNIDLISNSNKIVEEENRSIEIYRKLYDEKP